MCTKFPAIHIATKKAAQQIPAGILRVGCVFNDRVWLVQMSHAELRHIPVFLNVSLQHVSIWECYNYQAHRDDDNDIKDGCSSGSAGSLNI